VVEAAGGGGVFVPVRLCLRSNAKTIEVSFDGQYHSTLKATPASSDTRVEGFQAEEVFVKKSVVQRISLKVFTSFHFSLFLSFLSFLSSR